MATPTTEQLSEEIVDYTCFLCSKKNKVSKSEKFCLECQQHFCSTCLGLHNHLHDDHNLQDPTQSIQGQYPTERCQKHLTKALEMFCKDHDDLGCSTCAITDHRSCTSVVDIPSAIQQLFDSGEIGQIKTILHNTAIKLREGIESGKGHANIIEKEKKKHMSVIDNYVETLVIMIQNLGKATKQCLLNAFKTEEDKFYNNQTKCEDAEKEVQVCIEQLENNNKNKSQLFVSMKKGQKINHCANTLLQFQSDIKENALPHFEKNLEIEKCLLNMTCLGTASRTQALYKLRGKHDINMKTMTEAKKCGIVGLCLLSDGSILLSDCNNKSLKRLNPTTQTITDICILPAQPRGVCCISPQEAAVCLDNTTIQFVTLRETMALTRCIKLQHRCYGIDYHDNKLYVSNFGNDIEVYNMDGTLFQSGNIGLSGKRNVVLSKSGDRVNIADWSVGLVCVDRSMKELFRYNGHGLSGCNGVCIDHMGNVFVSGYYSHNVVQVAGTGQALGEVVSKSDGIQNPFSLCWDSERGRLYVAGWSNNIVVFEKEK